MSSGGADMRDAREKLARVWRAAAGVRFAGRVLGGGRC